MSALAAADTSHQLITGHAGRHVSAFESFGAHPWLTLNSAYDGETCPDDSIADQIRTEFQRTPVMPLHSIEQRYDAEGRGRGLPRGSVSMERARRRRRPVVRQRARLELLVSVERPRLRHQQPSRQRPHELGEARPVAQVLAVRAGLCARCRHLGIRFRHLDGGDGTRIGRGDRHVVRARCGYASDRGHDAHLRRAGGGMVVRSGSRRRPRRSGAFPRAAACSSSVRRPLPCWS